MHKTFLSFKWRIIHTTRNSILNCGKRARTYFAKYLRNVSSLNEYLARENIVIPSITCASPFLNIEKLEANDLRGDHTRSHIVFSFESEK